jgi:hypothetical protein
MRTFLCGIAALALVQTAFATVELRLTDTVTSTVVTITDPGTGVVNLNAAVGNWDLDLTGGAASAPGMINMDLTSLNATSTSSGSLKIEFTEWGNTVPAQGFKLKGSGSLVSGVGTSTISAWFDNGDVPYGHASLIGSLGPFDTDYLASISALGPGVPLYSLTEQVTLTSGVGGVRWSTDSSLTAVPEPAAVVLLGSLLVLCTSKLRRMVVRSW